MYDIIKYLDSRNIDYKLSGKNVTKGWIGTRCLFCDDDSNHLGINLKNANFSCWKCGEKGSFSKLISVIENISFFKAKEIQKQFLGISFEKEEIKKFDKKDIDFKKFKSSFDENCYSYFLGRNFDLDILSKKYKLMYSGNIGKFKFRVITPIILNGKNVSYIGISIFSKYPKYKFCKNEESLVDPNNIFYNIDNITSNKVIIVEGITDVWRLGDNSIASFGKNITDKQILFLLSKRNVIKEVFVFLDPDAKKEADNISKKLSPFFKTNIISTINKDPAELTQIEVIDLRSSLMI